jgi:hypothetical protein
MGISSKRDDENTIGQFGSGAKLAPISALREGWEWICLGADDRGMYRLEYITKNIDGYDIVYYRYTDLDGNVEDVASSFSLDAGVLSWDTVFQIYREAYANILDAHLEFDAEYTIDLVDEVEYVEGFFDIYLTASDEILEIFENHSTYFKFNSIPDVKIDSYQGEISLFRTQLMGGSSAGGKLYGKGGIWVGDMGDDEPESLFDYQCTGFRLNEERKLAHIYQLNSVIGIGLGGVNSVDMCTTILNLDKGRDGIYELEEIPSSAADFGQVNDAWGQAWIDQNGDNCVPLCYGIEGHAANEVKVQLQLRSYTFATIRSPLLYRLIMRSTPMAQLHVEKILGDRAEFDIIDSLPNHLNATLENSLNIIGMFSNAPKDIEYAAFRPRDMQESILGVYRPGSESILINVDVLKDGIERTISVLLHEIDHYESGLMDEEREFRDLADDRCAKLMLMLAELNLPTN